MTISEQIERQLKRIEALTPPNMPVKDYLSETLSSLYVSAAGPSARTPLGIVARPAHPARSQLARALSAAQMTIEALGDPARLAGEGIEGIVNLGTIEWALRPALPVRAGKIDPLPAGPWCELRPDVVERVSKSTCRIDLIVPRFDPIHVGSGFIAGRDRNGASIIVTNRHVVDAAVRMGWPLAHGPVLAADFERDSMDAPGRPLRLAASYQRHPTHDLALVVLAEDTPADPLPIAGHAPVPTVGLRVGVLGHPSFDSARDPFPKFFGFGNEFGIKRFSPGYVRAEENRSWLEEIVPVLLHDASTLSGSSGSCIIALDTSTVIGLHFGGWPQDGRIMSHDGANSVATLFADNGAVPLWALKDDPLLERLQFT
ncbi:serine protease [Sorangium sp. So ce118]